MKLAALVIGIVSVLGAQDGTPTNTSSGSPYVSYQSLYYTSSSLITYVCVSPSNRVSTVTVSAASNASPVSFTSTHQFGDWTNLGATVTPIIKITGGTGNWTAINGTWTATPTAGTTFTIPVDSTAFGALTGTLVVTTQSPRHNVAQWAVYHLTYSGTDITSKGWAQLPGGAGASNSLKGSATSYSFACSARATLAFE